MHIIEIENSHAHLRFSVDELVTLSNIVNELCYGIDMSDADLEIRVGASHSDISDLLTQILNVVDNIEKHDQDDSTVYSLLSKLTQPGRVRSPPGRNAPQA